MEKQGTIGKRILVVEDVLIAQTAATLILTALNFQVDIAESGASALRLFESNAYDLIFMDIGLPDVDGLTVTKLIREKEKESGQPAVPIVALTANYDLSQKPTFLAAGMDDFLSKPLDKTKAISVLEKFSLANKPIEDK